MKKIILVTGAASSGKSEWAESLAQNQGKQVIYIATGQKNEQDEDWMAKIAQHQQRRPRNWQNWEITRDLASAITGITDDNCVLIDSLGTWVANHLDKSNDLWYATVKELITAINDTEADIIMVAEETGWGVVPAYPEGRWFRRRLGSVTRDIGQISHPVYLVVSGYAVDLTQVGVKLGGGRWLTPRF
ncbi:MAG: bifunctional adenosylcobinamide kinase/adenosylcobinamide-phosphate guanylyltransferase [Cyanobacterium sp. T60_A2020_053]|nr:bifunctional adenosylcobinamide kinase/adenosylcobinamide-phosphate guanylyltransferase [Cyanobacterium sp. T60_A2020_053]